MTPKLGNLFEETMKNLIYLIVWIDSRRLSIVSNSSFLRPSSTPSDISSTNFFSIGNSMFKTSSILSELLMTVASKCCWKPLNHANWGLIDNGVSDLKLKTTVLIKLSTSSCQRDYSDPVYSGIFIIHSPYLYSLTNRSPLHSVFYWIRSSIKQPSFYFETIHVAMRHLSSSYHNLGFCKFSVMYLYLKLQIHYRKLTET